MTVRVHVTWVVLALGWAASARAQPVDTGAGVAPDAATRAADGEGLAGMQVAPHGAGDVVLDLGFDGARHDEAGLAAAEVAITPWLHAIGGAIGDGATWRPYVGGKLVLAPDVAVSVAYRAEGFTEPEGELEVTLAGGHRFGRVYVLGNGVYGQDVDSRNRDAELAGAITLPLGPVIASSTARARFALGSMQELGAGWDALGDLGATLPFGRYAARAAVGVSALGTTRVAVGPEASLALAAYF